MPPGLHPDDAPRKLLERRLQGQTLDLLAQEHLVGAI